MHIFLNLAYYRYEAKQHAPKCPAPEGVTLPRCVPSDRGLPWPACCVGLSFEPGRIALTVWLPRGGALVSAQGHWLLLSAGDA